MLNVGDDWMKKYEKVELSLRAGAGKMTSRFEEFGRSELEIQYKKYSSVRPSMCTGVLLYEILMGPPYVQPYLVTKNIHVWLTNT